MSFCGVSCRGASCRRASFDGASGSGTKIGTVHTPFKITLKWIFFKNQNQFQILEVIVVLTIFLLNC